MLSNSDFSIYVLTAPRPMGMDYLTGLLENLKQSRAPDPTVITGIPEEGEEVQFDWATVKPHRRISWGKVKLLKAAMSDPAPYIIFLEDDSRPVDGWWPRLLETVTSVVEKFPRFYMTLYTNEHHPQRRAAEQGKTWCYLKLTGNSGNVAQVITRTAIGELACFITQYCLLRAGEPSDMTMCKAAKVAAAHQITSVPSLVNHVGVITTKGFKRTARHAPFLYKAAN